MGSIAAAGCDGNGSPFVMSLQPLYTQLDLESDSRLIGSWSNKDGDVTFTFTPGQEVAKENEYTLVVKERDETQDAGGEFEVRLVRLGAGYFLDIYPQSGKDGNEFYRAHFSRAHSIVRVEITQDSLQMAFLDASWLKAKIEAKSVDTPHVEADEALLLTGTTEEVQELVYSHAEDDEAFAYPLPLERQPSEEEEK